MDGERVLRKRPNLGSGTAEIWDEQEQEQLIEELEESAKLSANIVNITLAACGLLLLFITLFWTWQKEEMRIHCLIDVALLASAGIMRWTAGRQVVLIYTTAALVIILVIYDGLGLLIPAWQWPVQLAGVAGLVLLMDVAIMIYAGALLYAIRSDETVGEEIQRLRAARYPHQPA